MEEIKATPGRIAESVEDAIEGAVEEVVETVEEVVSIPAKKLEEIGIKLPEYDVTAEVKPPSPPVPPKQQGSSLLPPPDAKIELPQFFNKGSEAPKQKSTPPPPQKKKAAPKKEAAPIELPKLSLPKLSIPDSPPKPKTQPEPVKKSPPKKKKQDDNFVFRYVDLFSAIMISQPLLISHPAKHLLCSSSPPSKSHPPLRLLFPHPKNKLPSRRNKPRSPNHARAPLRSLS